MAPERIRLMTRDRRAVAADADVVRYSMGARIGRGGAIFLIGVAIGAPTIVIPVLHLVLPWAIPLLALLLGILIARQAVARLLARPDATEIALHVRIDEAVVHVAVEDLAPVAVSREA